MGTAYWQRKMILYQRSPRTPHTSPLSALFGATAGTSEPASGLAETRLAEKQYTRTRRLNAGSKHPIIATIVSV
jgi:hypothetical protein